MDGVKTRNSAFLYHLKCQNLNENASDSKLRSLKSSQNIEHACYYLLLYQLFDNPRDLKRIWVVLISREMSVFKDDTAD